MSLAVKHTPRLRFVITATVIGNTLEWFDFALFSALVPLFSQLFFPPQTSAHALLDPLLFIALAGVARPIGGFLFGYLGDKRGRKPTIILTILLMTISATLVSILPSYASIGITATFLLGAICVFQGFCLGGEFPGSVVFLVESSRPHMKGYAGSWAYFGAMLGMFLGATELLFLHNELSIQDFETWGWRTSFFIGTALGITGILLRRALHETPIFNKEKHEGIILKDPLLTAFVKYKKVLFQGFCIFLADAIGFNVIIIFSTSYMTDVLKTSLSQAFTIHVFTVIAMLVFLPLLGWLSAKIGCLRQARYALCGMAILVFPLYLLMNAGAMSPSGDALWMIFVAQALLAILQSAYLATLPALTCALFPGTVRYSCMAIIINFSVAIFGATAPFLAYYAIKELNVLYFPSIYIALGALISLAALYKFKEKTIYAD